MEIVEFEEIRDIVKKKKIMVIMTKGCSSKVRNGDDQLNSYS